MAPGAVEAASKDR
jgi:hypothetical protein